MKKISIILTILLLISIFSGCKSKTVTDNDTSGIKNGTYVLADENESEAVFSPSIIIADKEISFSYDLLSSYLPHGNYSIKSGVLTMKTDDRKYKYVFQLKDNKLIFQKSESSSVSVTDSRLGAEIADCAEFLLQDN